MEDFVLSNNKNREWAIGQLLEKQKQLGRVPHKNDFDEPEKSQIKAFLGPWPRALEAAGLKKPSNKVKQGDQDEKY